MRVDIFFNSDVFLSHTMGRIGASLKHPEISKEPTPDLLVCSRIYDSNFKRTTVADENQTKMQNG